MIGAVAFAMHQMQYVEINAVLSSSQEYRDAADQVGLNGTAMEDATILLQVAGTWLGLIILGAALAQTGRLAWWQFACLPIWVLLFAFAGSIAPALAAVHLLLLPPFLAVAALLLRSSSKDGSSSRPASELRTR